MNSSSIRQSFFDFFKSKQHLLVDSAPIVIKNDPTLMFTNAGMNQFKDAFLGNEAPVAPRIVDTQKCLRVSGKHNDLEEVGVDTYHHTMFEMLGNWSFGDYFKAEMIPWAWEYLTEILKIDKDKLYVTIFEGDKEDQLGKDQEAYNAWAKIIDKSRILEADKKDNFWEMGEIGPCGPCSEIHIDLRNEKERKEVSGAELVNKDHPLVVEIWNLVFMEYQRMKDRSLVPLPAKHVDTGMGFERLCMAIQEKKSNYDTDLFEPLLNKVAELSGQSYGASDKKQDIAFRVIVDHFRAIAFSIADGQLPSNTGAGYVIRRILRRAVRYGYSFLGLEKAFLYQLIDPLIDILADPFKELSLQKELIEKVILEEENSFLKTLERGIQLFEQYQTTTAQVDGKFAFELYDTFGFPIDLTQLLAAEKDWTIDMKAFERHLKEQKDRSRAATKTDTGDWINVQALEEGEFVGYDNSEADVKISRYRAIEHNGKKQFQIVLDKSPFYAEGGGQVGDTGFLVNGDEKIKVVDTKRENNLMVHFVNELPQDLSAEFSAKVDPKRSRTAANHSATHLMHFALRKVLGKHVEQKGSLVHSDYLRFDFSHFQKVTDEEILQIEQEVNDLIRANLPLQEERAIAIEDAKSKGAMALFGEKYGDKVRMIQFGESVELCGGIHVPATGHIGWFKIIGESAVASGIRRIEAISGKKAEEYVQKQLQLMNELNEQLKRPKDLKQAVSSLIKQQQEQSKELEKLKHKAAGNIKEELTYNIKEINGLNVLIQKVALDAKSIKTIAFQLKAEHENLFMVLASAEGGKPTLTVLISEEVVKNKDYNASDIVRQLAKHIQGGGGGQAFFATAGGKNSDGIKAALEDAKKMVTV